MAQAKKKQYESKQTEAQQKNKKRRKAIALGITLPLAAAAASAGVYYGVMVYNPNTQLSVEYTGKDERLESFVFRGAVGEDTTITFNTKANYVLDGSTVKITINGKKLKAGIDYSVINNSIKINGSAVTDNKIYIYAKATIQSSKQKGTVEIAKGASKEDISVKAKNIVVGEDSTFELNLPEGTKITAMTLQNGNAILTYPDDFSIVDNVISIPGTKITDATITVTSITLGQKSVTGVELDIETSKDVYLNETFNVTATATFDSDTEIIDWIYDINYLSMTSSTSVSGQSVQIQAIAKGTTTLQAGCNGKWAQCTINISEKTITITGITATLKDSAKVYKLGDTFTKNDIKVSLTYYDGQKQWQSDPIQWGDEESTGDYYQIGYDDGKGGISTWPEFGQEGHPITAAEVGTTLNLKVQYKTDSEIIVPFTIKVVETDLTKITLDKSSLSLSTIKEPYSYTLTPTFEPSTATHKEVTWSSDDESVAKVDNNGEVTAIGDGQCTITCKSSNDESVYDYCTVKVNDEVVHVTGITINPTTMDVYKEKTGTITPTVTPDNATNKNVNWTSSDETVATVSDGVVTGVKDGTATITATTVDGGHPATCIVTVTTLIDPTSITLVKSPEGNMEIGDIATITATVNPTGAPQKVKWESSKPAIATVDNNGTVTAIAAGSTDIICTSTVNETIKQTLTVTVDAEKVYYEAVEYSTPISDECMIKAGDDFFTQTNPVIPATITVGNATKKVTGIDASGFSCPTAKMYESKVQSITFENGGSQITYIGNEAFANNSFTSFTLPTGVTDIPTNCFFNCQSLKNFNIDQNKSPLKTIGVQAFFQCYALEEFTIPKNVNVIESLAFKSCSGLKNVYFVNKNKWRHPSHIAILDVETSTTNAENLINCDSTKENNWGSSGITSTDPVLVSAAEPKTATTCYAKMTSLGQEVTEDTLTVPSTIDGLTVIGIAGEGFKNSQASNIVLPDTLTTIGENGFQGCSKLTSLSIPSGVTAIPNYAFSGCSLLTTVTLPTGLKSIGDYAFSTCISLETIEIPTNVDSIGEYAFNEAGSSVNKLSVTFANNKSNVSLIPKEAFFKSTIKNFTIPKSVTTIGSYAFFGCESLESVDTSLCTKLTQIGNDNNGYVFGNCYALTSFTIPASVTTIKPYVFGGCKEGAFSNVAFKKEIGWVSSYAPTEYLDVSDPATNADNFLGVWKTCTVSIDESSLALSVTATTHHLEAASGSSLQLTAKFGGSNVTASNDCSWSIEGGTDVVKLSDTTKGSVEVVDPTKQASAKVTCTFTYKSKTYTESFEIEMASWTKIKFDDNDYVKGNEREIKEGDSSVVLPTRYWKDGATTSTPVTTIAASGFVGCDKLTSIYISSSITTIQAEAFKGLENFGTATFADTSGWQQTGWGEIDVETPATNAANLVNCTGAAATGTNWGYSGIVKETIEELETTFSSSAYNSLWTTGTIALQPSTKYKIKITIPSTGEKPRTLALLSTDAISEHFDPDSISITKSDGTVLPWQWEDEDKIAIIFTDTSSLAAGDVIWIFMTLTDATQWEDDIYATDN